MLIDNNIDTILLAVSKVPTNAYDIDHVQVTENQVCATNGHSLYCMPVVDPTVTMDDYPLKEEGNYTPVTEFPVYIPRNAVEKAIRNRPKKTSLSILDDHICLQTNTTHVTLHTTDLDTFDTVASKRKDITFPDTERLLEENQDTEAASKILISTVELEILVKILRKNAKKAVELSIWPNSKVKPMRIDSGDLTGIIMPIHP